MNKLFLTFAVILTMAACKSNDKTNSDKNGNEATTIDSAATTSMQWLDSTYLNMGKVKMGDVVEVTYRFKNTGDKPLIIKNVSPGCGCTVAEKPTEPVLPGAESKIIAKFDSKGQHLGENMKTVTVVTNSAPENTFILSFRVEITE